ncbi:carboxypeptidase B-like [Glandiceps talaboti]
MQHIVIIVFSLSLVGAVTRFDGYQVLRIVPKNEDELLYLQEMEESNLQLDFWVHPRAVGKNVDIMVPKVLGYVTTKLKTLGFDMDIMIEDVQSLVHRQALFNAKSRAMAEEFEYSVYHTYEEVNRWIDDITSKYSDISEPFYVTDSYEGRKIRGVKIGKPGVDKPAAWFHSGIHAREWITVATMLWTVKNFLDLYGTDEDVTNFVDQMDYYIVPILNPDGYAYTWTDDRMWRKTRSPNRPSPCIGTDPNRNWGFKWGKRGASKDQCSAIYRGNSKFSEPETKGASDFILANPNFRLFIDFHAYSQMWLSPWGYTKKLPDDYKIQNKANKKCATAIQDVYGTPITFGAISHILGVVSGNTADWAYAEARIIHSYAVELRDTGKYGFLLPEDQIQPTAKETFEAIKVISAIALEG